MLDLIFLPFEMTNRRNNEKYIFDLLIDTIHFKRPKKFLCLNKVPHPHRLMSQRIYG